jgi:hypothetical protein
MDYLGLSAFLQKHKRMIDKESSLLSTTAKIALLLHYGLTTTSVLASVTVLSLSAANTNVISEDQLKEARIINIVILIFTAINLIVSGLLSMLALQKKSSDSSTASKLYQDLSNEFEIKILDYNEESNQLMDNNQDLSHIGLYYVARIRTIQINQPLIFHTEEESFIKTLVSCFGICRKKKQEEQP